MSAPRRRRRGRRTDGLAGSEAAGAERWAVSYADLVTLLFAFFTTLYAMSTVDSAKVDVLEDALRNAFAHQAPPTLAPPPKAVQCQATPAPAPIPEDKPPTAVGRPRWTAGQRAARRRLQDQLARMLRDPALAGRVELSTDPRGVRLTLGAAAFFEPGDSRLRSEAAQALAVLGDGLARHPGDIVVEGHTDDTPVRGGPFRSNWELSTARATEVVALLVERHGVPAQSLAAAGYAEHRPVADNDNPAGRAKNRRVDIVVIPADPVTEAMPRQQDPS